MLLNIITSRAFKDLLIAFSLPLMLFFVSPITVLLGNRDEYDAITSFVLFVAGVAISVGLIIFALIHVVRGKHWIYRFLTSLLLALSLLVWVQSQILVWDFGPLDGRGLAWANFKSNSVLELVIWAILVPLVTIFSIKSEKIRNGLTFSLPLLGLLSLTTTWITSPRSSTQQLSGEQKTIEESFAFHKKHNSLLIVLDTYQSDAFQEIWDKYPEEVEFLRGFKFYPDTVAGYPTTKHSIPLILTGRFYKNDFPWTKENRLNFFSSALPKFYIERKFGVTGTYQQDLVAKFGMIGNFAQEIVTIFGRQTSFTPGISDFEFLGLRRGYWRALDFGLFRGMPIELKKSIYDEGRWPSSKLLVDSGAPPDPHGSDWRFMKAFIANANTNSKNSGEFKYIHLFGAHYPLTVNKDYEYQKNIPDTREGYVTQARGVLWLTRQLLGRLKDLSIYDDAEILIVGDHGTHNLALIDLRGNANLADVPLGNIGAARPLMLYKPANSTAPLGVDTTPMHLAYIPCLLTDANENDCSEYHKARKGEPVVRQHYRYKWGHEFWFKEYAPPMTLYEVHGDARNVASWRNTRRVFDKGKESAANHYRIGETVSFGPRGDDDEFSISGFSFAEANHRWSDGNEVMMRFQLREKPLSDLNLQVVGFGFSPDGGKSAQDIEIEVNNNRVHLWHLLAEETLNIKIPKSYLTDDTIRLKFKIGRPTAPCELGISDDCRKLGLGLKSVVFTNQQ